MPSFESHPVLSKFNMTFLKSQNVFSHILKSYKAINSLFADFNRYFLSCKLRKKLCLYTNISLKNRAGRRNGQHYSRHTSTIAALLH